LRLGEEFSMKIDKVEVVQRVGFVAIMIAKKSEEKGKFWTKEAVQTVNYEGES
jgi:recombinational DNA repair protein RecT